MRRQFLGLSFALLILFLSISPGEIVAAPYYEGKTIRIVVGLPPGGGYDRMARILSRHLPKYIPGKPTILIENMPGAASMIATNYLYNLAKPDGLAFGTFNRGIIAAQLQKVEGARFDMMKFSWIGSAAVEPTLLALRSDSPYKTFEDIRKAKEEIKIGAVGPGDSTYNLAILLKEFLGLNLRIVTGYPSSTEIALAVERREVLGMTFAYSSVKPFIERGLVRPLLRTRISKPGIEHLPVDQDLTTDKMGKTLLTMLSVADRVGRPYVAPPKTRAEIMNILKDAFARVAKDPELKEESTKLMMDVDYTPADECLKELHYFFNQPANIVSEFNKYIKF